jgi:hypothetical protein
MADDIASLGFAIDSTPLEKTTQAMGAMGTAAKGMERDVAGAAAATP